MPHISVVVPCYNEAAVLPAFHAAAVRALEELGREFELVYVDDGSRDGTLSALRGLAAADPRARYLSLSRNFGKEAAVLAGLRAATGRAVLLMDADLQHPPALIPRMYALHLEGHDQVVARRDRQGEGLVRALFSRLYYRLVSHCVDDVELADGVGDFRLLSRRAVDALLALPERNRFSKGLFSWIGFPTVYISYTNVKRADGDSKWSPKKLMNYAVDGVVAFNSRPLRLAIHVGLWMAAGAFGYVAWVFVSVLVRGIETPGYATLLAAVVGLGGVQLFTLGVIGEYVGRIYQESKGRPHYLVHETGPDPAPVPAPQRTASARP